MGKPWKSGGLKCTHCKREYSSKTVLKNHHKKSCPVLQLWCIHQDFEQQNWDDKQFKCLGCGLLHPKF